MTAVRFALAAALGLWAPARAAECLAVRAIDSTRTTDARTILFLMRDKTVYRNVLPADCVGLAMDSGGFTYVASPGLETICATETSIRLNANGNVCQLGAFVAVPAGDGHGE